jgi:hypothetical protein
MCVRQRFGQGVVDAPVGAGDRFGTDALDNIQRRQDDVLVSQASRTLLASTMPLSVCKAKSVVDSLPIVRQAERLHAGTSAVRAGVRAGFLPLGILRPTRRVESQLPSDPLQQRNRRRHRAVGPDREAQ